MRTILSGMILLAFTGLTSAQSLRYLSNKAFKPGEKLRYSVNYGLIRGGTVEMEVKPALTEVNGRKCYHVVGTGKTVGAVDWFFPVRDYFQTFIDVTAILPQKFLRDVTEGSFKKTESVIFDHRKNIAINNGRDTVKMVKNMQDILSAYYYSRCLDVSSIKVNDTIPIFAYIDAAVTPFHLRFAGREVVDTPLGKFRCLVFKPQLELGRVFSEKEGMTIWVSDDANHVPVQVEAKLLVGALRMNFTSYEGLANPLSSKVP
jgi:hypothetical protein